MKKLFLLMAVTLLCNDLSVAQTQGRSLIDSLLHQLTLKLPDSTRCKVLYDVSYSFRDVNPDSGLHYAGELMKLAKQINHEIFIGAAYSSKGINYIRKTDIPQAMNNLMTAIKLLERTRADEYLADAYQTLSIAYYLQNDKTKALINSLKTLQLRHQLKDSSKLAATLTVTGSIYRAKDDYNKSDSCYSVALRINRKMNDKSGMGKVHTNMAINRSLQKPTPDYLTALSLQYEALALNLELKNNYAVESNYGGLGWLYMQIHLLKNKSLLPDTLRNAAENFNKGVFYLNKAIETGRVIADLNALKNNYFELAEFYEKVNKPIEALAAFKHYSEISDTILNKEKVNAIADLQISYETEKKEHQIKILKKESIAKTAIAKEEVQKKNFAYAGITCLILFGAITFALYSKRKKLSNELSKSLIDLKAAQEQLIKIEKEKEAENIRVRISRDIHDEIGSNLTKISLLSSISARNNKNGSDEVTEHLRQIQEYSHDVNTSLSEIVWAVSPGHDTLESLVIYMRKYIHDFFENTGVVYQINFPTTFEYLLLNPELKRNIFLVMKESLNNILKYAKAKNVIVDFKVENNNFELKVTDDGTGFDFKNETNGNGLSNMQHRMQSSGGDFKINSASGIGTEITASGKFI